MFLGVLIVKDIYGNRSCDSMCVHLRLSSLLRSQWDSRCSKTQRRSRTREVYAEAICVASSCTALALLTAWKTARRLTNDRGLFEASFDRNCGRPRMRDGRPISGALQAALARSPVSGKTCAVHPTVYFLCDTSELCLAHSPLCGAASDRQSCESMASKE